MHIRDFYQKHAGQTCLICGVGPNLALTPPEWFDYPSFGVNTIFRYEGWKPTYYVGVDERLQRENGAEISEKYADVPKFIPRPDRDTWQGENFYRFYHRPGPTIVGGRLANHKDALDGFGISYRRIMGAALQIAWHMGFSTMLMIGIQHKPDDYRAHFWGPDEKAPTGGQEHWFDEYAEIIHAMNSVRVLNISADTYVPENIIPRDDWQKWKNR
jgi:hypothetical protein